jgi:hypothetical protein
VDRFFDDVSDAYHRGIAAPGKELHFTVLVAFLLAFGFIRTSAHMIRAQVSWWPGNVETKSGTHIHHLVWGILLLMATGYVGVAVRPDAPWDFITAALFGIGLGLTLDEFALWLNLEDVYWQQKGRQSIDAVIVAATLLTMTMIGLQFFVDVLQAVLVLLGVGGSHLSGTESTLVLGAAQAVGPVFALACLAKGKYVAAAVGLFVPLVAVITAFRLARPGSLYARRRYTGDKLDLARQRYDDTPPPVTEPAATGSSA